MKDASGASQMDPKTQVTSLHGVSMLAAQCHRSRPTRLALLHELGGENDRALVNVAVGAEVNLHGDPLLAAAQAAREAGNAPNACSPPREHPRPAPGRGARAGVRVDRCVRRPG
jgi:hypothetical protein